MMDSRFLFAVLTLAVSDLAYAKQEPIECRRHWNFSIDLDVTRCFESHKVIVSCEAYDTPEWGIYNAELNIAATDGNNRKFFYGYGKALQHSLCNEHISKIYRLMRKADQVCITGNGESNIGDGETFVRWRGLETRNGKVCW